jgi:hypothetical protein
MNLYSVASDEAMKRLTLLNRFIATIFYSTLNASSPLLLEENRRLTLHRHYIFKKIHCLMLHRR